jgi:hypothetical protein
MVLGQITKIKTNFSTRVARPKLSINDFTTPARVQSIVDQGSQTRAELVEFLVYTYIYTLVSSAFQGARTCKARFLAYQETTADPPSPQL